MFTGIVRVMGEVATTDVVGDGRRLRIEGAPFLDSLTPGDSVAVSGVCLTVVDLDEEAFIVEAVAATLERTTVGEWKNGTMVNLEPALRAGDPLGGHIVQGHVDGVGRVAAVVSDVGSGTLDIALTPEVDEVTVPQGSLTIDGVSLTVNQLSGTVARFAIIPYTWTHTTLGRLEVGARVNVEADVIGKYVGRAIRPYSMPAEGRNERSEHPNQEIDTSD